MYLPNRSSSGILKLQTRPRSSVCVRNRRNYDKSNHNHSLGRGNRCGKAIKKLRGKLNQYPISDACFLLIKEEGKWLSVASCRGAGWDACSDSASQDRGFMVLLYGLMKDGTFMLCSRWQGMPFFRLFFVSVSNCS